MNESIRNSQTPGPSNRPPRIDANLPLAEGLRRSMLDQIEWAEDAAARIPMSGEAATRAAELRRCRKAIKRTRAILRLVRGRADAATIASIDDDLRDAGRRLSTQRDRDVRLQTIARLLGPEMAATGTTEASRDRPDAIAETDRSADLVQARMRQLEDRVADLAIEEISWSRLRRRISRRWIRTRRRLRKEASRGGDERLHAVRKACGRLETQLMLFEGIGDRRVRRRRKRISRVYETIGEDRDLALALAASGEGDDPLRDAIDRRRAELSLVLHRHIGGLRRLRRKAWSMLAPAETTRSVPPRDNPS